MGLFRILIIMLAMLTGSYCSSDSKKQSDDAPAAVKKKKKKKRVKKNTSSNTNQDDDDDDDGDNDDDDDDDDKKVIDFTLDLTDDEKEVYEVYEANVAESVVDACVGCHAGTAIDGDNLDGKNSVNNWEVLQKIVTDDAGINCSSADFITFLEDSNVHGGATGYLDGDDKLDTGDIDKWLEVEEVCIEKAAADAAAAQVALAKTRFDTLIGPKFAAAAGNCVNCHAAGGPANMALGANFTLADLTVNKTVLLAWAIDPDGINCDDTVLLTNIRGQGMHGNFADVQFPAASVDLQNWLKEEPVCIERAAAQ